MLLDKMDDVNKWMTNLAHLCYSPRLPQPFIVPECASVDLERGIIRRQGDVGNGYQQAETVNSIILCAGIDDNIPGILKIMPRLPDHWNMKITDYPVIVYMDGSAHTSKINMNVSYPEKGIQEVNIKVVSGGDLKNVNVRLGPFSTDVTSIEAKLNGGKKQAYTCFVNGDRAWAWVTIPEIKVGSDISMQTYN